MAEVCRVQEVVGWSLSLGTRADSSTGTEKPGPTLGGCALQHLIPLEVAQSGK